MPHILQVVEESGEDFADEIDDVPADEDELSSEPETKKRKVCLASHGCKPHSHLRPVNRSPRLRLPPLNPHRRKQNQLRVVPRKLSQLIWWKKIEIYLSCDTCVNVSNPSPRYSASPFAV